MAVLEVVVGFRDDSLGVGAAEPFDAGCASCLAGLGFSSGVGALSALDAGKLAFCGDEFPDSCFDDSAGVAIPRPLAVVGEVDSALFWLPVVSRSSELKLLTRAGEAGRSLELRD